MQGVRFDPKPPQVGEKDQKKREKSEKNVVGAGFELTTLRLQILHLTRQAKIAKCHNSSKMLPIFFSKVNQVIYSSSTIS